MYLNQCLIELILVRGEKLGWGSFFCMFSTLSAIYYKDFPYSIELP